MEYKTTAFYSISNINIFDIINLNAINFKRLKGTKRRKIRMKTVQLPAFFKKIKECEKKRIKSVDKL